MASQIWAVWFLALKFPKYSGANFLFLGGAQAKLKFKYMPCPAQWLSGQTEMDRWDFNLQVTQNKSENTEGESDCIKIFSWFIAVSLLAWPSGRWLLWSVDGQISHSCLKCHLCPHTKGWPRYCILGWNPYGRLQNTGNSSMQRGPLAVVLTNESWNTLRWPNYKRTMSVSPAKILLMYIKNTETNILHLPC